MIYDDGIAMDENGRAKVCPVCGNEQFSEDADFCRICGFAVYNLCEGVKIYDDFGNYEAIEQHKNAGNARFCEKCGQPTHFFIAKILKPFNEVREAFVDKYLQVNPLAIRAGQTLDVGNTSANISEDYDEELPF